MLKKVIRRLEMPMKKTKSFICFEMLEEGYKLESFFLVFSNKKQGNKYVQNILLTPHYFQKTHSLATMNWNAIVNGRFWIRVLFEFSLRCNWWHPCFYLKTFIISKILFLSQNIKLFYSYSSYRVKNSLLMFCRFVE